MKISRLDPHCLTELLPRGIAVAGFQQRIAEVLADIGAIRRRASRLFEEGYGGVVIVRAQSVKGFCQRFVGRVFDWLLRQRGNANQK
jgi:hypothetical protein